MAQGNHWIRRSTECAVAWREPRWKPLLLGAPRAWVHAVPGAVSAALTVTPVVARAAGAGTQWPGSHGS